MVKELETLYSMATMLFDYAIIGQVPYTAP